MRPGRVGGLGWMLLAAMAPACAQELYPARPIRLVVAIPAGSGTDTVARLIADGLSQRLAARVVVDNRPGGGTMIGNEIVAKAKPDGYTLLMNGAALAIAPSMYRKVPYETARDFAPITLAAISPNVLTVHPSLPATNVKELVVLARAKPDQILYSSGGHGVNSHLATALFAHLAGIRLRHVPYKGSTPGVVALLGGEVALMTNSLSTLLGHINAGKVRALGVGSLRRSVAAPHLPTIAEAGLPGYEASQWSALFAPAGTPRDIIAKLHAETVAVVRDADISRKLIEGGADIVAGTPDELAAFFHAELAKWPGVIRAAGLSPDAE